MCPSYLLDGGDNNDTMGNVNQPFPFPDALQEFSVETSTVPARNGLHPGAAVNVVTKSGSNALHGDLFEFLRNGDLNARNFFAARQDSLKRNQFGGTVGGKIIRDKLFFFGGYHGTRVRSDPAESTAYVPTEAALAGNFSQLDGAGCQSSGNTGKRRVLYLLNPSQGTYYGQLDITDDGGNANYNAMLASVQHRFSSGFTLLLNYTWSHCISDGDFNGDLRGSYYQNPFDRAADRRNCNFDRRHLFNGSMVVQSPIKSTDWKGRLLGNWEFAPLLQVRSGAPINVTSGKDNSLSGEGLDRPNLVAGMPIYMANIGTKLQWINAAAFIPNPAGTFGNVGRDTLTGPSFVGFDFSVSRLFALHEQVKLEARFRVWNNPCRDGAHGRFPRIAHSGEYFCSTSKNVPASSASLPWSGSTQAELGVIAPVRGSKSCL